MNKKNAQKLAAGCRRLAVLIETGKQKMNRIGRSYAFRDNGAPCCAFGHAVCLAGLKGELKGPFKEKKGFGDATGPKYWASARAAEDLLGRLSFKMKNELVELELANDAEVGDVRKQKVADQLNIIADLIEKQG